MTAEIAWFDSGKKYVLDGSADLNTDAIYLALLTSAFDPVPGAAARADQTLYAEGYIIKTGGRYYEAVVGGYSGLSAPTFPTIRGDSVTDGTVTWLCWGYCPPSSHDVFADVSANELPTADGYTAGGIALTNKALTMAGRKCVFSADPVIWTGASFAGARYAAAYRDGTVNAITDPLLFYVLLDNTPADVVLLAPTAFSVNWPATGTLSL